MSYQPLLPIGGVAGWQLLNRTMPAQRAAHAASSQLDREITYFKEKIGGITSAEALVNDRTLLKVALGAFGLQDDIDNRFFIRKVLEEGVVSSDSLANRLSDPRYAALSKAFGFGTSFSPRTTQSFFGTEITDQFRDRDFEVAVGRANNDLRLALGLERELELLLDENQSLDAQWFALMGSPPLRSVFESALGLPKSTGALDIDQQLGIFRSKAESVFGVSQVSDFAEADMVEELRTQFLLRSSLSGGSAIQSQAPAVSLLAGRSDASTILAALYGAQ